jgi:NTE family protein
VQIEGRTLIDGGLVNPLPFDELGPDVDITVAIDVSGVARVPEEGQVPTALGSLVATTQILQRSLVREKMRSRQPDVYVNISVDRFNALEFHKFAEILKAAEPAKKELIEKLRRVLASETVEVQQDEGLEVGGGDAR